MTQLNIVHLDSDSMGPDIILNRPSCDHLRTGYRHTAEADLVSRLAEADIAIVNKITLTPGPCPDCQAAHDRRLGDRL